MFNLDWCYFWGKVRHLLSGQSFVNFEVRIPILVVEYGKYCAGEDYEVNFILKGGLSYGLIKTGIFVSIGIHFVPVLLIEACSFLLN
tara:strand:+ start:410 stop:670 length:261 start_codon:yes stop_codon:yes gene_type:complete